MSERPIFTLRIRAEAGVDAIRNLRQWLKQGLRRFGLRCVDIRQEHDNQLPADASHDKEAIT